MEQRQISDLSERLEIYFTQLKKQVEALERDNHEIRQLLIKHVRGHHEPNGSAVLER